MPDNNHLKLFIIPVQWSVYSTIRVEAESLEKAVQIAKEKLDDIPITPSECEYIDDSYKLNGDSMEDFENAQCYADVSSIIIDKNGKISR